MNYVAEQLFALAEIIQIISRTTFREYLCPKSLDYLVGLGLQSCLDLIGPAVGGGGGGGVAEVLLAEGSS